MQMSEILKRKNAVSTEDWAKAVEMVRQGYGAHGISLEGPVDLKTANAAHAWVAHEKSEAARKKAEAPAESSSPLFADRSFHDANYPAHWQPSDGLPPGFEK